MQVNHNLSIQLDIGFSFWVAYQVWRDEVAAAVAVASTAAIVTTPSWTNWTAEVASVPTATAATTTPTGKRRKREGTGLITYFSTRTKTQKKKTMPIFIGRAFGSRHPRDPVEYLFHGPTQRDNPPHFALPFPIIFFIIIYNNMNIGSILTGYCG